MQDDAPRPAAAPEALLARYRAEGRPADLAALFDATAPELHRVALHLCRDAATADDVLQETFLVVMEKASAWDPARPALPWMLGILKNQALMARRRAGREIDPDRLEGPADAPDPAQEAADGEERERLRAAMQRLDEPYRGVALARWRYGLEPAAIAAERGVPAGTVRSWLHRAFRRLRWEMAALPALLLLFRGQRGVDGVRESILRRALVTAARRQTVGATASLVSSAALGRPRPGLRLLATAVVVAVATFAGWTVLQGDGTGEEPGLRRAPRELAAAPPPLPAAPAREPASDPSPPSPPASTGEAPAPGPSEIDVLVRDAEGKPVEGARVLLCRVDEARYEQEPFPGRIATPGTRTDASGRARLAASPGDIPDRKHRFEALAAYAEKDGAAAIQIVTRVAATLGPPDFGTRRYELTLQPGGFVQGTVRLRSGAALPGASLFVRTMTFGGFALGSGDAHYAVRTDADGRFRTPVVPRDYLQGETVLVRGPEAVDRYFTVDTAALDGRPVEVILDPAWTLTGRCVDDSGLPLAGIAVTVDGERITGVPERRTAATAPDGIFRIEGLAARRASVTVDAGERGLVFRDGLDARGEEILDAGDLRLPAGPGVLGQLVNADGAPVARALLLLLPPGGSRILARTRTDDEGTFSFPAARDEQKGYDLGILTEGAREEARKAGLWGWTSDDVDADVRRELLRFGVTRRGVAPREGSQRFVLGGLRIRFRFLDADTGQPLGKPKASLGVRRTGEPAAAWFDNHRSLGTEGAMMVLPTIDVPAPGVYQTKVEMPPYVIEYPPTVEVTAEREAIVEVRVRKK